MKVGNMIGYDVVIIGKFFNKRSWVSEMWRIKNPQKEDELDRAPERVPTIEM